MGRTSREQGLLMKNDNEKIIEFTPEQEAAIKYRGGSLLVSAAAGSGKTKVLVERLLSRIDENDEIDEFLVITYTRAAAYELREKIHDEFLKRLAKSPGSKRLRRQSLLCRGASIDTIHTFCAEILRENAHLVRLPPDFRVLDQSESELIMNMVAEDIIDKKYESISEDPNFNALVDTITEGRDDRRLQEILLEIHNKMQSLPYPGKWAEEQKIKQHLIGVKDVTDTDSGKYMINKIHAMVSYNYSEVLDLREEMRKHPEFEDKYAASVDDLIEHIQILLNALTVSWDEAFKHKNINNVRPNRISGYDELKEIRTRCLKNLKKSIEELEISSEEHIIDMKSLSLANTALFDVVLTFAAAYAEEKRKRGVVDFSDLEHLTLSILVDEISGERTALAKNLSKRYKEIMIDEYQDVNAVQENIFSALSNNNNNLFMVGDVKQSIYRFRLADPLIFMSKYNLYSSHNSNKRNKTSLGTDKGTKILLMKNFRSQEGIINTVNEIFSNIMSTEFGEMNYGEDEKLRAGRIPCKGKQGKKGNPYISINSTSVDIDVLDLSGFESEEGAENPKAIKLEADHIADKILKLTDGSTFIHDDEEGERIVTASDIVILLRSVRGRAWQYSKALAERGIKSEYSSVEDYFETVEIKSILSFLEVIDNPRQDLQLAAVLSGPVYKFSPDELSEIRIKSLETDYYEAIKKAADDITGSDETSLKCKKILEDIEELRSVKSDMSADRFIWHVYNKTGLLDIVRAMQGGKRRRNNLVLLAESARKFEQSGYKGLFGFLVYIRNLKERGKDLSEGGTEKSTVDGNDTVRIMSIHKSKGLEFPIVFLANTSKLFNFQDTRSSVVFHKNFGVGSLLVDKERRIKYSTLTRSAIQNKIMEETLSEELRVLYVAMTRAREKLIITAIFKDAGKVLSKIEAIKEGKVAPQAMISMQSYAEWILTGIREKINTSSTDHSVNLSPVLLKQEEIISGDLLPSTKSTTLYDLAEPKKPGFYVLKDEFKYSFQTSVDLPSKMTVTRLNSLPDPDAESASWIYEETEERHLYRSPSFISERKSLSPAERGILIHRVMQHIDYKTGSDESEILKELQRLEKTGIITAKEIIEIDKKKIVKFLNSTIGGRASTSNNLKKEFKFSILCPSSRYYPDSGDDKILLQGVVDCFFEEDGELVVLDFKTDRVNEQTIHKKAQMYSTQLYTYTDALQKITGKHVKEQYIYFFALDRAYPIDLNSSDS